MNRGQEIDEGEIQQEHNLLPPNPEYKGLIRWGFIILAAIFIIVSVILAFFSNWKWAFFTGLVGVVILFGVVVFGMACNFKKFK